MLRMSYNRRGLAMDKKALIKRTLINEDALETYPFERDEYKGLAVIRHKSNNKWYALIFDQDNKLYINLKCPPDVIAVLKEQYPAVSAAWHMNKKHWCKVDVNNIEPDVLDEIIKISFDVTAPKRKTKQ